MMRKVLAIWNTFQPKDFSFMWKNFIILWNTGVSIMLTTIMVALYSPKTMKPHPAPCHTPIRKNVTNVGK